MMIAHRCETMREEDLLKRITTRADVFGGKPIIRNMRISVEMVLNLLAQGLLFGDILEDYPDLEKYDIPACLAYAHDLVAGK